MKILVTGAAGQLGHDVIAVLAQRGHTVIGSDIADTCDAAAYVKLDITDAAADDGGHEPCTDGKG